MLSEDQVRKALQTVLHPRLKKSLVDIGMIKGIVIKGDTVTVTLGLKSERSPLKSVLAGCIERAVGSLPGVAAVRVEAVTLSREEAERMFPRAPLRGIAKVKHFLAVASGNPLLPAQARTMKPESGNGVHGEAEYNGYF